MPDIDLPDYADAPRPGTAQPAGQVEDDDETDWALATLWLPNPDTRHGWEAQAIARKKPKPAHKALGFRRHH